MRKNSQNCENRSSKALTELDSTVSQTLQTPQTSSYVSNQETHTQENVLQDKEKKNGQEVINESTIDQEKITDELAKSITQQEEEFFRSCSANEIKKIQEYVKIYKEEEKLKSNSSKGFNHRSNYKDKRRANKLSRTQGINWQWMPEGAWNINGKLDPAFQEWLAKKWLYKYDDIADIYEAKANVLAYFHNDPQKLPIRWEQYQEEFLSKADNIKTRLDHECKIKDKEKKDFLDRLSALKPLDESQSVSANNPIDASNLVINQYHQLNQDNEQEVDLKALISTNEQDDVIETEAFCEQSLTVNNSIQDADVQIVIDEENNLIETNLVNIDSTDNQFNDEDKSELENSSVNVNRPVTVKSEPQVNKNQSVVNKPSETTNIYAEDEWGNQVKHKDFTGIHEQEQIPVNKKAMNMIADWLKAKKGGRK